MSTAAIRTLRTMIHDVLKKHKDAQFIISSHSPILLGYPKAQILSFDDGSLHKVRYEETSPAQIVRHFVNELETFLEELLKETPCGFARAVFPGKKANP